MSQVQHTPGLGHFEPLSHPVEVVEEAFQVGAEEVGAPFPLMVEEEAAVVVEAHLDHKAGVVVEAFQAKEEVVVVVVVEC